MIDREDFPIRTPQQYMADSKRFLGSGDSSATPDEKKVESERIDRLFQKYIVAKENIDLKAMSLDEVLERFEAISLVEDEVAFEPDLKEDIGKDMACHHALEAVSNELMARGVEARRAVLKLYDHYNEQVRLNAAIASFAVAPEAARRVMEDLRSSVVAGVFFVTTMMLDDLNSGKWVPD